MTASHQVPIRFEIDRTKCTAERRGIGICSKPSTYRVEIGCVHEHVGWGYVCEAHLLHFKNGSGGCAQCRDLGHRCKLLARREERL